MNKRKHDSDVTTKLRSHAKTFSFHTDCYLCGTYVDKEKAIRSCIEYSHVMIPSVTETILHKCAERRENKAIHVWNADGR